VIAASEPLIKTLLIDIDDTAIDSTAAARQALKYAVAGHPAVEGVDSEDLHELFFGILEETHVEWMAGNLATDDLARVRMFRLVAQLGRDVDPDEAGRLGRRFRSGHLGARRPVEGAIKLLEEVRRRGVMVFAVTNNSVAEQEDKLRHCRMRHLLEGLVASQEVGIAKPDPRIFSIALDHAGCNRDQAVMLGDSWENDVLGAYGAGINAVWLNRRGRTIPDEGLAPEIRSLAPAAMVANVLLGERNPAASAARPGRAPNHGEHAVANRLTGLAPE
jgi:putative hydrolase of the HAD superfamily